MYCLCLTILHDTTIGVSQECLLGIVQSEIDDLMPRDFHSMGHLRKCVQKMRSVMTDSSEQPEDYSLDNDNDDDFIRSSSNSSNDGSSSSSSSSSSNSSNSSSSSISSGSSSITSSTISSSSSSNDEVPCQSMLNSSFAFDNDWPGQVLEMIDRGFTLRDPYMMKVVRNMRVGALTKLWKGNKFKFAIKDSINAVGR